MLWLLIISVTMSVCYGMFLCFFFTRCFHISVCKCVEEGQSEVKSRADAGKELDILRAKVCVTFCCCLAVIISVIFIRSTLHSDDDKCIKDANVKIAIRQAKLKLGLCKNVCSSHWEWSVRVHFKCVLADCSTPVNQWLPSHPATASRAWNHLQSPKVDC